MENSKLHNDEIQKDTGTGIENKQASLIPGRPYSKLPREFSEDDLKTAGGQRFLLSEIDRLDIRSRELENFEKDFYMLDKEKAVLQERFRTNTTFEILYGLFLTIGSAIIGLGPFFWEINWKYGLTCIGLGFIMLVGSLVLKVIRWK